MPREQVTKRRPTLMMLDALCEARVEGQHIVAKSVRVAC